MANVSRRNIAKFLAKILIDGEPTERVAKVLAAYLIESKQTRMVELYLRDIMSALASYHGYVAAEVESAHRINTRLADNLTKFLRDKTGAKKIELIETIDSDLIGGIVVRTPDAEMDNSLKTRLAKLREI